MDKNLSEREIFLLEFEKQLSISETLYQRIMKIVHVRGISMEDFYTETGLNRTILSDIKKNNSRSQLRIVITICIGLRLETRQAFDLIRLAGYALSDTIYLDCVYAELISHYNDCGIEGCNERLAELGIDKKYFLGSQQRK